MIIQGFLLLKYFNSTFVAQAVNKRLYSRAFLNPFFTERKAYLRKCKAALRGADEV